VDDVLSSSRFVSTLPGAEVSSKDIRKLKGLQWLNDEVITFYSIMINLRSRLAEASPEGMGDMKKVYSFTSFFYAKFAAAGHAGVKTWTRKVSPTVAVLSRLVLMTARRSTCSRGTSSLCPSTLETRIGSAQRSTLRRSDSSTTIR
jgi:hypothetical protein